MSALEPGAVVAGRYRIEALIGEGGMGRVHLARHLELGERVALKVLRRDRSLGDDAEERLRREAKAVARMRGENIARVTDAGVDDAAGPFLVMEYVAGRSLSEVLAADGPVPVERAVDWALQVCVALAEAHGLGIVHRDLKPSNLRLTAREDGTPLVKVLDFGIAKVAQLAVRTLTETANMLGSPHYMSPEQIREARAVDARTDVWSLGVVLYELVTNKRPFDAFTMAGVVAAIAADEPASPREHRHDLDEGLAKVILRMLAKDVGERFASTVEAAEALAPFGGPDAESMLRRIKAIAASPRGWSDPPVELAVPASAAVVDEVATVAATSAEPSPAPDVAPRAARRGAGAVVVAVALVGVIAFAAAWPGAPQKAAAVSALPAPPTDTAGPLVAATVVGSIAAPSGATASGTAGAAAAPSASGAAGAAPPGATGAIAPPSASARAPSATARVPVVAAPTAKPARSVHAGEAAPEFDFGPRK